MRVGVFTYGIQHPDRLTGIPRYTMELTRALTRLNADLEIVLLNPYPESEIEWYGEFESVAVRSLQRLPAAATWGNLILNVLARKAGLDVFHDPCGIAPFLVSRPPHARVVTIHDVFARVVPSTQDPLMRLLYSTLLPLTRHTADAVLTVSEASRRDLHRYLGLPADRTFVTPLGFTLPEQAPLNTDAVPSSKMPYFLFVGNLTPRKNLLRVIQAFVLLRKDEPGLTLKIVGPKFWGSDEISALARETPGVELTGFVSEAELDRLYRGARALVFPSLYEGFGLPALEAMARGCPVIGSNVSSLPEVIGDAGLQVDPHSVEAIAGAMRQLQVPELRATLRARGLLRAGAYSWRTTAEQTLAVYQTVLDRRRTAHR